MLDTILYKAILRQAHLVYFALGKKNFGLQIMKMCEIAHIETV